VRSDDPYQEEGDEAAHWMFRDLLTLVLFGFVFLVVAIFPMISETKPRDGEEGKEPPGNVIVEMRWPDAIASDVDLWVQAPGDLPVGYSNKGGALFNLLRDDLGDVLDATNLNYEVAYSRGLAPGEYTVNVHLYRNAAAVTTIPVTLVVSTKSAATESSRQILTTTVDLSREGEEITAFRFRLDSDGVLERGSVHSLYKPLRDAGSK
jgi:hypothetical protein